MIKIFVICCQHVTIFFELPFTKNVDCFETSQMFCIANLNNLTGFCIIRVLTERCFLTDYSNFFNVPKSVSGIDLFRYECKLVIFFSPLKCHVFSGYIEDLFSKKLFLRLPFFHRSLNWKSIILNSSFFCMPPPEQYETVWKCLRKFWK